MNPLIPFSQQPMKIALLSDIHSNLPALESVLELVTDLKADVLYCLGDIVGYGPFPNECVDLVRSQFKRVVRGNHDAGASGQADIEHFNKYGQAAIKWTRATLTSENLAYLMNLPLTFTQDEITIVHASPVRPAEWTYVLSLHEALECFQAFTTQNCFVGHTHIPIIVGDDLTTNHYRKGKRHLINVGSVGQPRDGNPNAAFGMLDTTADVYTLHRVPYEIKRTSNAIKDAGLPTFLGKRLHRGI
jgi:putative phosphoesterase